MTDRELLQQALYALERAVKELRGITATQDMGEAIAALRDRLAQPEGFRLLPVEATAESYRAMLAAAPKGEA